MTVDRRLRVMCRHRRIVVVHSEENCAHRLATGDTHAPTFDSGFGRGFVVDDGTTSRSSDREALAEYPRRISVSR